MSLVKARNSKSWEAGTGTAMEMNEHGDEKEDENQLKAYSILVTE